MLCFCIYTIVPHHTYTYIHITYLCLGIYLMIILGIPISSVTLQESNSLAHGGNFSTFPFPHQSHYYHHKQEYPSQKKRFSVVVVLVWQINKFLVTVKVTTQKQQNAATYTNLIETYVHIYVCTYFSPNATQKLGHIIFLSILHDNMNVWYACTHIST